MIGRQGSDPGVSQGSSFSSAAAKANSLIDFDLPDEQRTEPGIDLGNMSTPPHATEITDTVPSGSNPAFALPRPRPTYRICLLCWRSNV